MTYRSLCKLGLTSKESSKIIQTLRRSQISGRKICDIDVRGNIRDIMFYDDVAAYVYLSGRLDETCMRFTQLYNANR